MYFTVTTILTVGYGDITAFSLGEKVICIFLMLIGVISFSFATGALSSIISNLDSKEALLKEKISTLNDLRQEYNLDPYLFKKLARTVKYDAQKKSKHVNEFMAELPHKLRLELMVFIHQKMYSTINFFKERDESYLAWVVSNLKTVNAIEKEYLFKEGEDATESKHFQFKTIL